MKSFQIVLRTLLCAALLGVACAAPAQTQPGDLTVDVPFDFIVTGKTMPAGHYIVAATGDNYIRIFQPKMPGAFVPTHHASRTKSDGSKLVFHRYGDKCFLSAVWVTGNDIGRELGPSRLEREAAARAAEMELAVVRPAKPGEPSK
jgi:hypothetical protein